MPIYAYNKPPTVISVGGYRFFWVIHGRGYTAIPFSVSISPSTSAAR